MIDFLRSFFGRESGDSKAASQSQEEFQVAVCAILFEVAHANQNYTAAEDQRIDYLLEKYFNLDHESLQQIKATAEREREGSVDLYYFTKTIRQNYSVEQREVILEMLWKVVYADGHIDKYEEQICRRLTDLIGLHQKHYIDAKLKVAKNLK